MRVASFLATAMMAWLCMVGSGRAQSCSVSGTAAAFGSYLTTSTPATTTMATISVSCQATVQVLISYAIALSPGSSGNASARRLQYGNNSLAYGLYTDTGYSHVWGDGTGGTSTVQNSYLLGVQSAVTTNSTVYGQIPALQNVMPGIYQDTVIVSVVW